MPTCLIIILAVVVPLLVLKACNDVKQGNIEEEQSKSNTELYKYELKTVREKFFSNTKPHYLANGAVRFESEATLRRFGTSVFSGGTLYLVLTDRTLTTSEFTITENPKTPYMFRTV
ncbi:hypothetical protein AWB76_00922 [Caballeronia temeraria]|uniref:Uncharacterized protein n=1 Tax=Caballeronia temeraria TaxID=1777137 RepID=A0A157ZLU7_9BURK|nr:hypothetical protein AWB76_00922 [Caballeronia temeraria]